MAAAGSGVTAIGSKSSGTWIQTSPRRTTSGSGRWQFRRVKLKPTKLEFFGVLGRSSGAVRTAAWKRCKHGGVLCG